MQNNYPKNMKLSHCSFSGKKKNLGPTTQIATLETQQFNFRRYTNSMRTACGLSVSTMNFLPTEK